VGLRLNVTLYRVMAYVTGVILVVLCVLAILQVAVDDAAAVNLVGTVHGLLYIVYLLVSYPLTRRLRLTAWPTVAVLLAGTIPVMTFVVERRISHRYIAPALAAENDHLTAPGGTRQASPGAAPGGEAGSPAAHTPGTPSHPAEQP
jgi:integral membrane protein